jgi:prepilin peptidase CpaA
LQTVLFGLDGFVDALLGAAVGGVFLVPLYMGGGMGAGDVKLLAAVGSFFGFAGVISVLVCTLLVGGLLGIALIAWRKTGPFILFGLRGGESTVASVLPGIPYACAIAAGSLLVLLTAEPGALPLLDMR